ncbi:serine/threonine-protein kinase [Scleromatobacter humisilvae]|uniref:Protein kinase n=1 Tax=Scleromatobacter humisilvae TaxID=2897159 RepID=A0A9X1YNH5_9BURK|nr:serine/threonine-protein kinase [Scleromatobacter humisilvae]MCK9689261.1 protein kinase [Scleromatobacter humisilvae]
MPLDATDLATLSRLLDEALDLAPERRAPWLAALPPDLQRLRPQLQAMLDRHAAPTHAGFLSNGPRLDGEAPDPSGPRAGERVGPYVLIRELGHGGMGTVWLAARADGTLKRQVALKLPRLAWGPGLARRMARERDIVARLAHPNIARLYDAGLDDQGRPYLALEFIDGQPIDAWCGARALPLRQRLALAVQVAMAVGHAHGSLVVHRDLKASNILVTQVGEVHLLDFGIAKLLEATDGPDGDVTQTQARLLTPRYASPEQADGRPVTVASDVYSLGVVLHQLLTGSLPSPASPSEDPAPASRGVVDRGAARALRGDLDAIVGKALRHDPARRYATMEAFANDLENHLAGRPVQARPDGALYVAGRFARRHWFGLAAAAAICVAIVAGGATAIVQARHAAREAERAKAATEFVAELFRLNAGSSGAPVPTEFIDRGASLTQARFAGQPEMQAALLGAVGEAYDDMGANSLAAEYATRRLQLLQQLPDTRKQQVQSLLLASNAYVQDEDDEAAAKTARRALEVAGSESDLRLDSLAALARAQFENGNIVEARQSLRSAQTLLQAAPRLQDSAAAARVLCVEAMLLTLDEHIRESKPQTARAVSAALRTEGAGSRSAEDLLFGRALAFLRLGMLDDARANFEQAMSISRQRSSSLARLREAVRSASFWSIAHEKTALPFQETLVKVQASHDLLEAQGSAIPPTLRAKVDYALGCMYMDWTNVRLAAELLDPSIAVLQRSTLSIRSRISTLGVRQYMAHLRGRDSEALDLLWELLHLTQQLHGSNSTNVALSHDYIANELTWQGQFDRAEQVLDAAPHPASSASSSRAAVYIANTRANIALARGDPQRARTLLPPEEGESGGQREWLLETRSRVLCQTGASTRGLSMLRDSIRRGLDGGTYVHDPDIAMMRSRAGLCALAGGQRALAVECAREARRAFDEQPLIGPRYREPLIKLEQSLHLTSSKTAAAKASTSKLATDDSC